MTERISVQCCVAGGGPAGMMLGYLLARAGISVVVLEKHGDFLRDFRGDTIHPSTLEIMESLGLADEFLQLPHTRGPGLKVVLNGESVLMADYERLRTRFNFITVMPQWDFLNFLTTKAVAFPTFELRMNTTVTDLVEEDDRVVGVRAESADGTVEVRSDLVVACDGRSSTVRARAGLEVDELGAPIDVLWFRISRRPDETEESLLQFRADDRGGRAFARINRSEHWQCGLFIAKGSADEIRQRGLGAFRDDVSSFEPSMADRVDELASWDDVPLLSVQINRLRRWHRPGLICIGDAAHAMSPVGGVGVNLAIQDAVATANILTEPLRTGRVTERDLHRVQRRRGTPTRIIQRLQVRTQDRGLGRLVNGESDGRGIPRWTIWLLRRKKSPMSRLIGRVEGMGIRRERVRFIG